MNAVFEFEVNSCRKLAMIYVRGQIVPQNSPAVAEAISIVIAWYVATEQQAYFQNL